MRTPPMPQKVMIENPGEPMIDPVSRNKIPGAPTVVASRAYLAPRSVADSSLSFELAGRQDTVINLFTLLVPARTPISAKSVVTDEDGVKYQVTGEPARRPRFIATALKRVSDLQK